MKSKPITAEEHFIKFYKETSFKEDGEYPTDEEITELMNNSACKKFIESNKEYAVLFAKHHREQIIEAMNNEINEFYQCYSTVPPTMEDIENAYPESKIA